jgi:hypothetical protein
MPSGASKSEMGFVELRSSETLHASRIKQRFAKIAKDAAYRRRFTRPLEFPLKRHGENCCLVRTVWHKVHSTGSFHQHFRLRCNRLLNESHGLEQEVTMYPDA